VTGMHIALPVSSTARPTRWHSPLTPGVKGQMSGVVFALLCTLLATGDAGSGSKAGLGEDEWDKTQVG